MISIIVPVYNVEAYLRRCVDSILTQTYSNFELILVDDGSTDRSGALCDEYARLDSRVLSFHKKNGGLSSARNAALRIAKGDYFGFVDSDDWIFPTMFERMMNVVEKYAAEVVICNYQLSYDTRIEQVDFYAQEHVFDNVEATKEILKNRLMSSHVWNKLFKKTLFEGIFFPEGRLYEDIATTYKLLFKANKVVVSPFVGYNYFQNDNGICLSVPMDMERYFAKKFDYALAYNERYIFSKRCPQLIDFVPLCAEQSFLLIRDFVHTLGHKRFKMGKDYDLSVDAVMNSFTYKDLQNLRLFYLFDYFVYQFCKPLYMMYIGCKSKFYSRN